MNKRERTVLYAYCQVARKIMRPFLGPNSCVSATRLTIECLKRYSIMARPQPFKMAFEIKGISRAYTSGLSEEEMGNRVKVHAPWGQGYKGHVCAIWEDVLIDPSLDQANDALNVNFVPERVMLWPLEGGVSQDGFKLEMDVYNDDNKPAKLTYITISDYSFFESEAWENGVGMQALTDAVVGATDRFLRELRKSKVQIPA